MTEDTIAAGEINLTQIDLPASLDLLDAVALEPTPDALKEAARSFLERLGDAGVSKLYLTVPSRALMRGGVCFIFPCNDPESVSEALSGVVDIVLPELNYTILTRETDVVVCPALVTDLFEENAEDGEAASRPEISDAFASVDGYPHRLVFDLPSDLHNEIAAVWPEEVTVGGDVKTSPQRILERLESVACGWSFPPETDLEVRFICVDGEAAAKLHDRFASLLALVPPNVPRPEFHVDSATVVAMLSNSDIQTFLAGATEPQRRRVTRMTTSNSVKRLALALHNFYDVYKFFPGKYTVDADGKPLLSWRVALLPYLEQNALYEKFKRDEPWDSHHNRALLDEMPDVYQVRGDALPEGHTRIRLPVIEGSAWSGEGPPITFKDMTDGSSNTLWGAVAPESAAVPWTKPDDWELDAQNLIESFFGDSEATIVGRFDGSVSTFSREIDPEKLQALLTIAGGEVID